MIAETFSGLWYLHEPFALRMQEMILPRLAAGKEPIPAHFKPTAKIDVRDTDGDIDIDRYQMNHFLKAGGGDVAVIPIEGVMSRFGICGMGNEFTTRMLSIAEVEPKIKAVVLKGYTPGGTVDSIEMLSDTIKNFQKPIVGYVNGMVASAGVFAFSQTDLIVMEDSTMAEIGSIGAMSVYMNRSAALEKEGIAVRIFRASESVDKARLNGIEPLTEELVQEIQTELNMAMKAFKGYVRRGRAGKLTSDEVFSGKMYKKKEAMELGLVDRIGSLADAVKVARKMA